MKFLEINNQIMDLVDTETGEISDPEAFEKLELSRKEKITGIANYVLVSEAEIKAMEEHAANVLDRAKTAKKKIENMKKFVKNVMEANSITKIENPECVISIPKPRASMVGDDTDLKLGLGIDILESELKEKKAKLAKAKKDIKTLLETGEEVEGFSLIFKTKLSIK